jgi:hypothetical protein
MSQESSLTSPHDRDLTNKWKPEQNKAPLSDEETKEALEAHNLKLYKFPKIDRVYRDPPITMQNIALVSFVPSKGAVPDKHGIYGFCKVRGVFNTDIEADERAEYLIRNVDSYHPIFHAHVGFPIPMTTNNKYSGDHREIDVRKQMSESISSSVKNEKEKERQQMLEIKEKEKKLLEDVAKKEQDPCDRYTELRVKKAQLTWTYINTKERIEELKKIITKTRKEIEEMDSTDSSLKNEYFEKYQKAREEAGIKEDSKDIQTNFMKYLVEDVTLDF